MKTSITSLLLVLFVIVYSNNGFAQKEQIQKVKYQPTVNQQMLVYALSNERKKIFEKGMILNTSEEVAFWEVYNNYETDKEALDQEKIELINAYNASFASLTNEQCIKLVNSYMKLQKKEQKMRNSYYKEMTSRINAKVASRFFQIDEYLTAAVRMDILDNLPLIGDDPQ